MLSNIIESQIQNNRQRKKNTVKLVKYPNIFQKRE